MNSRIDWALWLYPGLAALLVVAGVCADAERAAHGPLVGLYMAIVIMAALALCGLGCWLAEHDAEASGPLEPTFWV